MSKPTAREYSQARLAGESARRNGEKATANPWRSTSSERERILRDEWDDGWHWENNRRARA